MGNVTKNGKNESGSFPEKEGIWLSAILNFTHSV